MAQAEASKPWDTPVAELPGAGFPSIAPLVFKAFVDAALQDFKLAKRQAFSLFAQCVLEDNESMAEWTPSLDFLEGTLNKRMVKRNLLEWKHRSSLEEQTVRLEQQMIELAKVHSIWRLEPSWDEDPDVAPTSKTLSTVFGKAE